MRRLKSDLISCCGERQNRRPEMNDMKATLILVVFVWIITFLVMQFI